MRFSYNWLKSLISFKESPQKLAELLTLRSFEVESVEKVGKDFALEVKVPANRVSDAAHHIGLAREIAAIKNSKLKTLNSNQTENSRSGERGSLQAAKPKAQNSTRHPVRLEIVDRKLCSRYTAQALEIKQTEPSPKWMQERLETCGFRPIDAVVDVTNYVMLERGQPLHAFDLDKIREGTMTIRESRKEEKLTTLDGTTHTLPQDTIVIADRERVIDLAGIMGGENSALSKHTKKILLQAAVFNPVRIYKTSRLLNFTSAAAKIYAAGIDPNQSYAALERAIELLEKNAGAKRTGELINYFPNPAIPLRLLFRPDHTNRLIGQNLAPIYYKSIFERLGFAVEKNGEEFIVEIPTARRDISLEEDLVEEVSRLLGYEHIKPAAPETVLIPTEKNDELFWEERVRDYLIGAGFIENLLYEFTGDRELQQFYVDTRIAPALENPMSPETKYLVPRLLIKYVASAAENLRNFESVKVFGIGKSFRQNRKGTNEHKDLITALARKGAEGEEEFYQLKGAVDQLLENLGIADHWYDDGVGPQPSTSRFQLFHPHRFAEIKIGDEKIGNIGEINQEVLKNIKAKARIVAAEINFEKLWKLSSAEAEYRPIGKYPAVVRDLAVVIPEDTKTESVLNVIENIGGELLVDTDLFDYFQDGGMRELEEKSLAFHLIFQSPERTLKDEEVNKVVEKITKALEEKGWEVRK